MDCIHKGDMIKFEETEMKMTENKYVNWMKKHKRLLKALLMSLLPLVCCVVACALQGKTISQVYLPAGEWNDELFYFKQVEGIVHFGYPRGYFGFNESHALKASFAAWSPVLVFPWILWGLCFGWNLLSPIYCNIFLMMLAVFLFVWLTDADKKQLLILTILFASFTPITRYMLSGMPECICFSLVIIVLGLSVNYQKKEKNWKLGVLLLMTAVMTLMRPYLILFMLFPIYYLVRKKKWKGAGICGIVVIVTGGLYAAISHFFSAEYFTPLFDTTWVATFLHQGIFAGIKYVLWRLLHVGINFFELIGDGIKTDLFWGEYFGAFLVVMLIILLETVLDFVKKRKKEQILHLYLSVCFVGMWVALLLMYKMKEGSKHLLTFTVAGIFAISLMETRFFKKAVLTAAVFAWLFVATPTDPYEHKIPFSTEELLEESSLWKEVFSKECVLETKDVPNYENSMIWVFADMVEGQSVITRYQMLYQLPEGFGISCCYADYVTENLTKLQSKYVAVTENGTVDQACKAGGYREIERHGGLVVYELH